MCLTLLEHAFQKETRGPVWVTSWKAQYTSLVWGLACERWYSCHLAVSAFILPTWLTGIWRVWPHISWGHGWCVPLVTECPKFIYPSSHFNDVLTLKQILLTKTLIILSLLYFLSVIFHSPWPRMEMSLPGISNHRLGCFSKVGRKQCWWPSELPELLRVGVSPDTVKVRFLLLTTVSGTLACCGCTGGLWDSGIWHCNGRGEIQVLPERRCLRVTSRGLHVPGACASLHSAGVPVNPSHVCMEFLGLQ